MRDMSMGSSCNDRSIEAGKANKSEKLNTAWDVLGLHLRPRREGK
jgi:hypothetical protein